MDDDHVRNALPPPSSHWERPWELPRSPWERSPSPPSAAFRPSWGSWEPWQAPSSALWAPPSQNWLGHIRQHVASVLIPFYEQGRKRLPEIVRQFPKYDGKQAQFGWCHFTTPLLDHSVLAMPGSTTLTYRLKYALALVTPALVLGGDSPLFHLSE